MDNILDYNLEEKRITNFEYASIGSRVAATFIDFFAMTPLIFLNYYNSTEWKSSLILLIIQFLIMAYKPYMETKYGATFGKMAMKIVVTDYNYQKPRMMEILMRQSINIGFRFINLLMYFYLFQLPAFKTINNFNGVGLFTVQTFGNIGTVLSFLVLIEVSFIFFDKKNRTLHDKIGKTYVVMKDSLEDY